MRHRIVSIFSGILLLLTAACCNKEESPQLKINLADNTIQATEIYGSHSISFNTNQEWSISFANPAGNDWVSASPLSGKPGNHNITIQVQTNPHNKTRSQTLVIAAGTLSRSVQIEQSGAPATISLDKKTKNLDIGQGEFTINVTTNQAAWSSTALQDWFIHTPTTAEQSSNVKITYSENEKATPRNGSVVFVSGSSKDTLQITQSAASATINIDKNEAEVGQEEGSLPISVQTNDAPWVASGQPAWITLSPSNAPSSANITINYQSNPDAVERHATITFTAGIITKTLVITQQEALPTISLDKSTIKTGYQAGTSTLTVTTNDAPWVASGQPAWITLSPSNAPSSANITINYQSNPDAVERHATITFTAGIITKTLVITQQEALPTISLDKSTINTGYQPGTSTLTVTTNKAPWHTSALPQWITLNPATGNQTTTITLSYSQNSSTSQRESQITFYAGNASANLSVSQQRIQTPPVLTTKPAAKKTQTAAESGGEISDDGGSPITSRGVCWSNQQSPTINDNKAQSPAQTNQFTVQITGLQPSTTYYARAYATNSTGTAYGNQVSFTTYAADAAYRDGEYALYQSNTKGNYPCQIIFVGDGYTREHFTRGGLFDQHADEGIEAFFSVEPYKSYRDYFQVYKLAAHSQESGVTQTDKNITKVTAFDTKFLGGSSLSTNTSRVFTHAMNIPSVSYATLPDILIILIVNEDRYAGTCWMWSDGKAIAIVPVRRSSTAGTAYSNILNHEAGGHGFAKLADEYVSSANTGKTITTERRSELEQWKSFGFYPNVDLKNTQATVIWSHYIGKTGYERVGVYEGGYYFTYGVWRPEQSSCMVFNEPYYNAPSREAAVRRIMRISGENFSMEQFLQKDISRAPAGSLAYPATVKSPLVITPLAPPVLLK